MTYQQTIPQMVEFPLDRSTSLRFASHADGITTLGFRSQKTGLATSDYDYPDPTGEHFAALTAAERPGTYFRRALRAGEFPVHIDKRPAGQPAAPPVQTAIIIEMPGPDGTPAQTVVAEQPKPAPAKIEQQVTTLAQQVTAYTISDQAGYERAVELTRGVKALQAKAEAHHRPVIDAAHKAHRAALDALKRILDPLQAAEATLKQRIGAWVEAENRRREEEARKAREEAARIQREAEERQRAEYERQLAEARERAEQERLEREAQIEAALEEAEANGASAVEVEAIMAQAVEEPPAPVFVPPPPPVQIIVPRVPVAPAPKVQGVSVPTTIVGVIEDQAAFLRFVADNADQYAALVEIKQGALDRLGKATDGRVRIAGVRWEKRASVSIRK
jgi:hypothetical protein